MEKKGLQLAISTIVVMVLAVVVLLFLILFFRSGSENFLDTLNGLSSSTNVDSVVHACTLAADTGQTHAYCCEARKVVHVSRGDIVEETYTCSTLRLEDFVEGIPNVSCGGVVC